MAVNVIVTIDGVRRFAFVSDYPGGTASVYAGETEPMETAITPDGRHHRVVPGAYQRIETIAHFPVPTPAEMVYRVTAPYTTQRGYETASNFREYEVQPGDYPVRWVTSGHRATKDGEAPYYGSITLNAVQTRDYYVSQAFGQVLGVTDERPMTATTISFTPYAYDVDPARSGAYIEITPATGEILPDSGEIEYTLMSEHAAAS